VEIKVIYKSGLQGPKGETGDVGPVGPAGIAGPVGPVGPAGPVGATGPQGIPGVEGPQGPIGPVGPEGAGVQLKGSVATVGDLPMSGNVIGDSYIVDASGDLYVWTGAAWDNVGKIVGPAGPQGIQGQTGPQGAVGPSGPQGNQGESATIAVGTTTTIDPGLPAAVVNVGTASDAIFNFSIPKGEKGDTVYAGNIDGGVPDSVYGGTFVINGGVV
jgi:hypothetical protein